MVFDCKGHLFSPLIPLALGRSPRVVPRRLYELLSKMGVAGFDNAAAAHPLSAGMLGRSEPEPGRECAGALEAREHPRFRHKGKRRHGLYAFETAKGFHPPTPTIGTGVVGDFFFDGLLLGLDMAHFGNVEVKGVARRRFGKLDASYPLPMRPRPLALALAVRPDLVEGVAHAV